MRRFRKRLLIPVEKKRCWPRRRWWNCLLLNNREDDSISTQGPAGLATRQSVRRFYSRWENLLCRFCVLWGRCQIWLWALVPRCSALASSFAWGWASCVQVSAFCYTQEFSKTGRSFVNISSSPLIAGMVRMWVACCGYCASKDSPLWLVAAWCQVFSECISWGCALNCSGSGCQPVWELLMLVMSPGIC